jgi:hypothetical protein
LLFSFPSLPSPLFPPNIIVVCFFYVVTLYLTMFCMFVALYFLISTYVLQVCCTLFSCFYLRFCKRDDIFNCYASKCVECGNGLLLQWSRRFVNIKTLSSPFLMIFWCSSSILVFANLLLYQIPFSPHFVMYTWTYTSCKFYVNFDGFSFVNVLLFHFVAFTSSVD